MPSVHHLTSPIRHKKKVLLISQRTINISPKRDYGNGTINISSKKLSVYCILSHFELACELMGKRSFFSITLFDLKLMEIYTTVGVKNEYSGGGGGAGKTCDLYLKKIFLPDFSF